MGYPEYAGTKHDEAIEGGRVVMVCSHELLPRIDEIQAALMKKIEPRPFDREGKKDGNYNFIHQEDVADAFAKLRKICAA